MSNQTANRIFIASLKSVIQNAFKLCVIAFAWCMRLGGLVLTKTGEVIEKIVIKKS
jgi:hypothetical protein